jgi:hypothetical protein
MPSHLTSYAQSSPAGRTDAGETSIGAATAQILPPATPPRPETEVNPVLPSLSYHPDHGPTTGTPRSRIVRATVAAGDVGAGHKRGWAPATAAGCLCRHWPRLSRSRLRRWLSQGWRRKARHDDHDRGAGWRNGQWRLLLQRGPLKYSGCMRSHGVLNFPEPGASDGIVRAFKSSVSLSTFVAASLACAK